MLLFTVKVVPSAGHHKWSFDKAGQLKCHLKSPSEKGLANAELIKHIAKAFGVVQSAVTIVVGQTSRTKTIKVIANVTLQDLYKSLGIEKHQKLFD